MQFFCIGCGAEMEAVLGEIKQHHFRHKNKGDCNPETYYHRLAKRILKYRFDSQPQFIVKYYVRNECPKSSECELRERHNWKDCSGIVLKTIDLKEYYDTCEEEASYNGFRADLLLTHREHPERKPVFLEISVTHDCEQPKINSKIRIIEIKVQSEIDVFREIVENEGEFVEEIKNTKLNENKIPPVRFYNFKRKSEASHHLSRFYLYQRDKEIYHGVCKSNAVVCQNANTEHEKNACFEVMISENKIPQKQYGNLYVLGMALAYKQGFGVKSCVLCAHYGRCVIYHGSWVNKPSEAKPILVRNRYAVRKLSVSDLEQLCPAYHCGKYHIYEYSVWKIINSFKSIPYWGMDKKT
jgi:hypothetical protein